METIAQIYDIFLKSTGICTDTRKLEKGNLFIALKGGNFNGNKFAQQALDNGAIAAVIDEKEYEGDKETILVENGLVCLQDLARHHRDKLNIPVVGLTGSNGKTTTKELINVVLSTKFKTFATQGNLNNHIGVPLSILSIKSDIELAIIEMGANHIGEIAELCTISQPTHGMITNIGKAHLEGFGSLEGVAKGKSELYYHLLKNDGVVFVNATSEILTRMSSRFENPLYYLSNDGYYNLEFLEVNPYIKYKSEDGAEIQTKTIGSYNFDNMVAALSIGKFFGVDMNAAHNAIAEYESDNNRSQIVEMDKLVVLKDAYNANPTSMDAAITNFSRINRTPKSLILGDMKELGDYSKEEHSKIIELVKSITHDQAIFIGPEFHQLASANTEFSFFEDVNSFLNSNKDFIGNTEGILLLKGSRGIALEKIID